MTVDKMSWLCSMLFYGAHMSLVHGLNNTYRIADVLGEMFDNDYDQEVPPGLLLDEPTFVYVGMFMEDIYDISDDDMVLASTSKNPCICPRN